MNIVVQETALGNGKLTVMIKDCIDIEGFKTLSGSAANLDQEVAESNADVVNFILAGDCKIVAKTNMHELAFGITGINHFFGTPLNYKYPERIPGGSSSGSAAAVAAELVDFSVGTDTGGSIRMPAACCGVIGFKPSFGRVSRQGVHPAQSSLDCVGPLARSVPMIETAMQILDPSFSAHALLTHTPKLAYLSVDAQPEIWSCIEQFFAQRCMAIESCTVASFQAAYVAGMTLINYENWQAYKSLCHSGKLGADVYQRLMQAATITEFEVADAIKVQAQFKQELEALFEHYDALILPTLPQVPPKVSEAEHTAAFLNLTSLVRPFNLSGHPAISLPLETDQGEPVGLQIICKENADEYLCAVAKHVLNQDTKK